jgi:hypothetical protein
MEIMNRQTDQKWTEWAVAFQERAQMTAAEVVQRSTFEIS